MEHVYWVTYVTFTFPLDLHQVGYPYWCSGRMPLAYGAADPGSIPRGDGHCYIAVVLEQRTHRSQWVMSGGWEPVGDLRGTPGIQPILQGGATCLVFHFWRFSRMRIPGGAAVSQSHSYFTNIKWDILIGVVIECWLMVQPTWVRFPMGMATVTHSCACYINLGLNLKLTYFSDWKCYLATNSIFYMCTNKWDAVLSLCSHKRSYVYPDLLCSP